LQARKACASVIINVSIAAMEHDEEVAPPETASSAATPPHPHPSATPWWAWASPMVAWVALIIHFLVGTSTFADVTCAVVLIATVFAAVHHAEVIARLADTFAFGDHARDRPHHRAPGPGASCNLQCLPFRRHCALGKSGKDRQSRKRKIGDSFKPSPDPILDDRRFLPCRKTQAYARLP
jgi:hypothetical protein